MEAGLALAAGVGNLYSLVWGAIEGRMSASKFEDFGSEKKTTTLPYLP